MKKAILLQLPVPGFLWPVLDANIPLAAGYLAAWAQHRGAPWEIEILPWEEVDVLGDEALVRALIARDPDVVGFSLYLWNAERSLYLARRLSEAGIPVLVGGPEVAPGNAWFWEEGGFAGAIREEGEEPFLQALEALKRGVPLVEVPGVLINPARSPGSLPCHRIDLSQLPSPYLSGWLAPSPDGTVWLETQRGCPFRCAYCSYGKRYGAAHPFPESWLADHLAWARERNVCEIYLMDPSFNVRPDWDRVLGVLEKGNPEGRLRYHTELVADSLRAGDAGRLVRAGLRSCEVGLQTVRPQALERVGRPWNRGRWIQGVRELLEEGVSVSVGLIVGLPGDDLRGFQETLSFLQKEVPRADLQVFPLSLLPGTELADRAKDLGMSALGRPPYTVTRTAGYRPEDLHKAFDVFEETTGLELDPFGAPPLGGTWESDSGQPPSYLSGVKLDAARVGRGWPEEIAPLAARNLCLWIAGWTEGMPTEIGRLSRLLPHCPLTVVLDDGIGWPSERLTDLLAEAGTGERYLDRYFAFLYGHGGRVVPRLAVLVRSGEQPGSRWLEAVRSYADVVWGVDFGVGWMERLVEVTKEGETAYLRGNPPVEDLRILADTLSDGAGEILFESKLAEVAWQRMSSTPDEPGPHRAEERRLCLP